MTEQNGEETKPYIHADFGGPLSAEITLSIDKCSPVMLWGAADLIRRYADDLYSSNPGATGDAR